MKRVIVGKNTFRIDMISLMVFIICIIFHNIPVFSVISVLVFFSYFVLRLDGTRCSNNQRKDEANAKETQKNTLEACDI